MNKNETLKILAMLSAFYAGGKNDPEMQVAAWHLILQKYDYEDAKDAVLHFAENDTRDYASFPAVGVIVKQIRIAHKRKVSLINEIIMGVSYGREYETLSTEARGLISANRYTEWLDMDAEEFQTRAGTFKQYLQNKQKMIGEKND